MGGSGYAGEAFEQSGSRGVEELIGNAEDSALADSAEMMPVALSYDLFEGNAVSGSAPGEEEDVGIGFGYGLGRGVGAGLAEVSASGGFYQFGDPALGVDEGLAPFFAIDQWGLHACD